MSKEFRALVDELRVTKGIPFSIREIQLPIADRIESILNAPAVAVCKCGHIEQCYCHDLSKTEVFIGMQNQCQWGLHKFEAAGGAS